MKLCRRCDTIKELAEFYIRKSRNKPVSWCKDCAKEMNKNKDKLIARNYDIKRKYGISEIDYQFMLDSQNGVCKICNNAEIVIFKEKIKMLAVDHCHKTDKIRGLLCHTCNVGIGHFKDDIEVLINSIIYLENHKSKNLDIYSDEYIHD